MPAAPYPADLYAVLHTGTPGDVPWYAEQCDQAASILELGCGDARVLSALYRPGRILWGIDLHEGLLELARQRIGSLPRSQQGSFILRHGDMRDFELGRTFDRVLIPHSGLYCLLSEEEVHHCLTGVRRHLAPGGSLLLDAYAADRFHVSSRPTDVHAHERMPVATVTARGRTWQVLERSAWDRPNQRIDVTYEYVHDNEVHEGHIAQRYLRVEQLRAALQRAGLQLTALLGSFEGGPFEVGDPLWAARAVAAPSR